MAHDRHGRLRLDPDGRPDDRHADGHFQSAVRGDGADRSPPPGEPAPPSGLPTTLGVTVPHSGGNSGPTTGGLYIHGDVQQMNLSVDPGNSTTQIIQVQQTDANNNPYTTTITLNASNNTTSVHVDYMKPNGGSGTYSAATTDNTYTGVTNGVVYCDGNVGGQTGTENGRGGRRGRRRVRADARHRHEPQRQHRRQPDLQDAAPEGRQREPAARERPVQRRLPQPTPARWASSRTTWRWWTRTRPATGSRTSRWTRP